MPIAGANTLGFTPAALIDGAVGVVIAPAGPLLLAIAFTIEGVKITGYDLIADPVRLNHLDLAILDRSSTGSSGGQPTPPTPPNESST